MAEANNAKASEAAGSATAPAAGSTPAARHEPVEVNSRALSIAVLAVVAILIAAAAVAYALVRHIGDSQPSWSDRATVSQLRRSFPEPLLEPAPAADIAAFKAEKQSLLNGYGWIDRGKGIVRIPIERAIELTANQGRSGER